MKMQSSRLLSPLSEESIVNLTAEVKETLANGYKKTQDRILSTAELWNIQSRLKPRMTLRFI